MNQEGLIQCRITDTGIGIAKEAQTRIFQSFDQADTSVTRKYGGTGLGLSIVKSLVELMGGTIGVQSPANPVLDNGSCFTFTLRLKMPVIQNDQVQSIASKKTLKKAVQILVVDDNPVNLLVARKMLEKFGAAVVTAENGVDAIKLAQSIEFDLILMDLQMPLLDGYASAREIRKLNYKKPIIALSASAYQEDIKNSLEAGMNGHLHKPFTETELFQAIDSNS
jgi:CheY-like chemotaxis protein